MNIYFIELILVKEKAYLNFPILICTKSNIIGLLSFSKINFIHIYTCQSLCFFFVLAESFFQPIQAPFVMIFYLILSGTLLTHLRRPISRLTVTEQRLEGELRFVNSRLITNSEEVAFYQGNIREKKNIDSSFKRLVSYSFFITELKIKFCNYINLVL